MNTPRNLELRDLELWYYETVASLMDTVDDGTFAFLHGIFDNLCQRPDGVKRRLIREVKIEGEPAPCYCTLANGWRINYAVTSTRLVVLSAIPY